jgi:AAA+ ATPase superfamily predicted ATPase
LAESDVSMLYSANYKTMITQYTFVGRQQEAAKMEELRISSRIEMLAIVGRRRVGKTELIREVLQVKLFSK